MARVALVKRISAQSPPGRTEETRHRVQQHQFYSDVTSQYHCSRSEGSTRRQMSHSSDRAGGLQSRRINEVNKRNMSIWFRVPEPPPRGRLLLCFAGCRSRWITNRNFHQCGRNSFRSYFASTDVRSAPQGWREWAVFMRFVCRGTGAGEDHSSCFSCRIGPNSADCGVKKWSKFLSALARSHRLQFTSSVFTRVLVFLICAVALRTSAEFRFFSFCFHGIHSNFLKLICARKLSGIENLSSGIIVVESHPIYLQFHVQGRPRDEIQISVSMIVFLM